MHFSALVVAALAAVASAGPAMKRQAECPEVGDIPACGVSLFLSLSPLSLFKNLLAIPTGNSPGSKRKS